MAALACDHLTCNDSFPSALRSLFLTREALPGGGSSQWRIIISAAVMANMTHVAQCSRYQGLAFIPSS